MWKGRYVFLFLAKCVCNVIVNAKRAFYVMHKAKSAGNIQLCKLLMQILDVTVH